MFEFLNDIGGFLGNVSKIASPISSIIGAIQGPQKITVPKPQTPAAETYAIGLLKAIAQPGNSLVKQLAAEELKNLMAGQQSDIRSKVLADRRERSMGRAPVFFDPERADENIAFQLSRGGPMLAQQAQSNAIQRIMSAAGVGNYANAQYGRSQDYQNALGAAKEAGLQNPMPTMLDRLNTGFTGIQSILQAINKKTPATPTNTGYGGYGPFPQNYSLPGGESIQWNQMRY